MSVFSDMAYDAGYRGEEQRAVANQLEQAEELAAIEQQLEDAAEVAYYEQLADESGYT